jgi:hypothetical protein
MKKLWLAVIAAFGLMGSVHADDVDQAQAVKQQHHHNFLSKRPYAKVPVAKQDVDGKWIGAGIVTDKPEKGFDKHQQMQLHFIGRRPYTAPMAD